MLLNQLKDRAQKAKNEVLRPSWVSDSNATVKAYNCILDKKKERLNYIQKHNSPNDYGKKSFYRISASEVAAEIKIATTTLISTSKYSSDLKKFLDSVNDELEIAKDNKIAKHKKTLEAGTKKRKKDELVLELQQTRAELDQLKKRNAEEQVKHVLANLPLPIKRQLGLNV